MTERFLVGDTVATRLDDARVYDGVLTRRVIAFLIDYSIVLLLLIPFGILVALLGLLTFGLGWALFAILGPAVAIVYVWNTLGGPHQATSGMRVMGIRLDRLDGGRVELIVPAMNFGGERHWFAVKSEGEWHRDPMPEKVSAVEERRLYLTPGGEYTEADIKANGGVTASEKFKGLKAEHDAKPKPGDRICPVSRSKANPKFAWVIGGKEYLFCCPPCVDEFVRLAKEQPDRIKTPDAYWKR